MEINITEKIYEIVKEVAEENLGSIGDEVKQYLSEMLSEKVILEISLDIFEFGDKEVEDIRGKKSISVKVNFVDFEISKNILHTTKSLHFGEYISGRISDLSEKNGIDATAVARATVWDLWCTLDALADEFGFELKKVLEYPFLE